MARGRTDLIGSKPRWPLADRPRSRTTACPPTPRHRGRPSCRAAGSGWRRSRTAIPTSTPCCRRTPSAWARRRSLALAGRGAPRGARRRGRRPAPAHRGRGTSAAVAVQCWAETVRRLGLPLVVTVHRLPRSGRAPRTRRGPARRPSGGGPRDGRGGADPDARRRGRDRRPVRPDGDRRRPPVRRRPRSRPRRRARARRPAPRAAVAGGAGCRRRWCARRCPAPSPAAAGCACWPTTSAAPAPPCASWPTRGRAGTRRAPAGRAGRRSCSSCTSRCCPSRCGTHSRDLEVCRDVGTLRGRAERRLVRRAVVGGGVVRDRRGRPARPALAHRRGGGGPDPADAAPGRPRAGAPSSGPPCRRCTRRSTGRWPPTALLRARDRAAGRPRMRVWAGAGSNRRPLAFQASARTD